MNYDLLNSLFYFYCQINGLEKRLFGNMLKEFEKH